MTREEKKKYVDAYNKLVDLVKDGYLKQGAYDQAIRDLLFEIISKFDKEIADIDVSFLLGLSCKGCTYEDLAAYSYPCMNCGRIFKFRKDDEYVEKEKADDTN